MPRRNGRRRGRRADLWQRQGGGCVQGRLARGVDRPCDDTYVNVETEEEALLLSTEAAHAKLPDEAPCIRELARRPGVELEWRGWREEDDE